MSTWLRSQRITTPIRTRSVSTPIVEDDPNRGMSDTDMDTILDMESTDTLARTFRPVEA